MAPPRWSAKWVEGTPPRFEEEEEEQQQQQMTMMMADAAQALSWLLRHEGLDQESLCTPMAWLAVHPG